MSTCWVLTDSHWPHKIKAASDTWHCLWKYAREETINQPISILQKDANEFASSMLMRRFHQNAQNGTHCTNSNKFGQLYSHVAYIIKHPSGLLAISTEISPRKHLRKHEKFADAHTLHPHLTDMAITSVLNEVARHMSASNVSHEQRFLKHLTAHKTERIPVLRKPIKRTI